MKPDTGDFAHGNGGGGGGIVIMASPLPPVEGTVNVTPAIGGKSTTFLTAVTRSAGNGGGGSGGFGASGGHVLATGEPTEAFGGASGYVISLTIDPTPIAR